MKYGSCFIFFIFLYIYEEPEVWENAPLVTNRGLLLYWVTLAGAGSKNSARGGRQGNDDLIWDGNERFLTYANTDLQLFKMFIAIL